MSLTGEKLRGMARGLFGGSEDSTSAARADQLAVGRTAAFITPTTVANTDATFTLVPYLDRPIRVKTAHFCASAAQATAAADGWVFSIKYDDGAGGASTAVASATVTATAIVVGTVRAFTLTAPVDIPAGKRLFLFCDATNTAAAANAMVLNVDVQYDET